MRQVAHLSEGDAAPHFDLEDDRGARVTLDALRQGKLVLYFFPKADTSG
jgi:peroxiredoxin Q/BCP